MKGLRLIRLLAVVAVALTALVALALTLLYTLDLSGYREPLERGLSAALGRAVTLSGPIRVRPSLRPTFTVRQVALANPRWARRPALAEAERLTVQFRLTGLLRGRLQVERVTLSGAQLHLETRADGRSNWLPPTDADAADAAGGVTGGGDAGAAGLASLPVIEVLDSRVDYRDGRSGVVTRLTIARAHLTAELDESLHLAFVGTLRGQELSAELTGGPLVDLLHGEAPWPVRLAVLSAGSALQARGELRRLPDARFDLAVHLSGADFASLSSLVGVQVPPLGPFELKARLVRSLAGYQVSAVRGFLGPEDPRQRFSVQEGQFDAPVDGAARLSAAGGFRGMPFSLRLTTAPYHRLVQAEGRWPLTARLHIARTDLEVDGTVQPAGGGFSVEVRAKGADVRTLEPLLRRTLPSIGPYALRGRLSRAAGTFTLEDFRARVGQSDARGHLRLLAQGARPVLRGSVEADALDVNDLRAALAAAGGSAPRSAGQAVGAPVSLPISQWLLPGALLRMLDGELRVRIGALQGLDSRVEEVRTTLLLRDARLLADPVHVRLAGQALSGRLEVRADGPQPTVSLEARGLRIAYGPVLAALHITQRLAGQAETLDFSLRGKGPTLQAVWRSAALRLDASGGTLVYLAGEPGRDVPVEISAGWATTGGGAGLELQAAGRYRAQPFTVRVSGGGIPELADDERPWDVRASGTLAGSTLSVEGSVRAVFRGRGADLRVRVAGVRLSDLDPILGTRLPNLGPYRVQGRLADTPHGVRVGDLQGRLGQSDFAGQLRYDTYEQRGHLATQLRSGTLRLADLRESPPPPAAAEDGRLIPTLVFPTDVLRGLDVDLAYAASVVHLARSELRELKLEAHLRRGNLAVEPFSARVWNGALAGSVGLDVSGPLPLATVSLAAKGLDYARALGSAGQVGIREGSVDVGVSLRGSGHSLREALSGARGTVEFLGGEGRIDSEILNLWASDLLLSMLPSFGKEDGSPLRCAVGHFDVAQGLAATKSLMVDLDRLVIKGNGTVALDSETLDFLLWPDPRDPSLISVTTPVRVSGTLSQPSVSPQARGVAEDVAWLLIGASNPLVLLLGLIKPGALEVNPCIAALATGADKAAPPEHDPPTPFSKVGDFFRGVGHFFERTFGGGGS